MESPPSLDSSWDHHRSQSEKEAQLALQAWSHVTPTALLFHLMCWVCFTIMVLRFQFSFVFVDLRGKMKRCIFDTFDFLPQSIIPQINQIIFLELKRNILVCYLFIVLPYRCSINSMSFRCTLRCVMHIVPLLAEALMHPLSLSLQPYMGFRTELLSQLPVYPFGRFSHTICWPKAHLDVLCRFVPCKYKSLNEAIVLDISPSPFTVIEQWMTPRAPLLTALEWRAQYGQIKKSEITPHRTCQKQL